MNGVRAMIGIPRTPRGAACGMARYLLYGVESGVLNGPLSMERHRAGCLVCQAASVRQRRIMRELASLRYRLEPLPHDIAAGLEEVRAMVIPGPPDRRWWSNRLRVVTTSVVSVAAISALVFAGRRMRSLVGGG